MSPVKILSFALALGFCCVAAQAAEPLDRIVVVVNDGVILQSELDQTVELTKQQIASRGITAPPDDVLRQQVLEHLVLTKLQTQRADDLGIKVDDRELNDVLTKIAKQNGMDLAGFTDAMKKQGMDYLAFRDQVRDEVLINQVRQREVENRVTVTDQDIDLFLANGREADDNEYHLAHILVAVPDGATPEQRAQLKAKAEDLLAKIRAGADFAQTAVAYSNGQQALQGGDLGWRKASELPTLFASRVPKMKPGDVSQVIEEPTGYHIVKLEETRGSGQRQMVTETSCEHILLTPNTLRDEKATELQAQELYKRIEAGEDFEKLARQYSDDTASKNAGGQLGWLSPGMTVPEFQGHIDQLKPGQISPPFHTQYGWHIARVIERRTRDMTEESRRAQAREAIFNRKANEEYDAWLRQLRDEAYVEYRLGGGGQAAASTGS